jgi:hypothetical protein
MGKRFAECSGVWSAASKINKLMEQPLEVSKTFEGTARGAGISALYMYSLSEQMTKPLSAYNEIVDAIAEPEETRIIALFKINGPDNIKSDMDKCTEMIDLQREIINMLREQMYLK